MGFTQFVTDYALWHYQAGLRCILGHIRNFLWFVWQLFAPVQLITNLLSPWRRMHERYPEGFNLKAYATALIVNTIMRLVSAFVRLGLLSVSIICMGISAVFTAVVLLTWLLLPAVLSVFAGVVIVLVIR